jgi:predicted nucleic acid-binding protein
VERSTKISSLASDIAPLTRRNDPDRWITPLSRRRDADLPFHADALPRQALVLLDTSVYIDELQRKLPSEISALLLRASFLHSSVARAEIAFSIGRLAPKDPRTRDRRALLEQLLDRMPARRRVAPSNGAWLEAALLVGILARVQRYDIAARQRLLNDALIFMTAREHGATLVSRNVVDFDFLSTLRPDVKVLFYRTEQS